MDELHAQNGSTLSPKEDVNACGCNCKEKFEAPAGHYHAYMHGGTETDTACKYVHAKGLGARSVA